mmetsp:Transcript_4091/g.6059  ORF Transcript_4091/g.6059 Transcript_4091/m.6059 type:complete len:882 (+) Transcript_4091:37-2682(+)
MKKLLLLVVFLTACFQVLATNTILITENKSQHDETPLIDFTKLFWTITNQQTTKQPIHITNVTLPSYPITELAKLRIIPDPLVGYGDTKLRWLSFEQFVFECDFHLTNPQDTSILRFEGLDTITTIMVNEHEIGKTDNMFVTYEFDVSKVVQDGLNTLKIVFDSAPTVAKMRQDQYPYTLPVADPVEIHGEPNRNFLRKAQYSFGWDWGPSFPVSGIYRPIYLYQRQSPVLTNLRVISNAHPHMVNTYPSKFTLRIRGRVQHFDAAFQVEVHVYKQQVQLTIDSADFDVAVELDVQVEDLWMPVGLGKPILHDFLLVSKATHQQISRRIGFRSVILDMNAFQFVINGIKMFAKGSNFIPVSPFQDDYSRDDIDRLLEDAVDAHMNMIRVWGGGIYQDDYFYDRCDALGLLVWQELMFACQMTPIYKQFMQSVEQEIEDQVTRLIHHPSIVLWSGNNENEVSLFGNTWYADIITPDVKSRYVADYWELTQRSFSKVLSLDNSRPFWLSSPSRGYLILDNEGTITGDWGYPDGSKGDTHHYDYKSDCTQTANMPKSHFVSEYGYQSMPSYEAWKNVSNETLSFDEGIINHRQHHPNGNKELKMQIAMYFTVPSSTDQRLFEKQIYLTQAMQALCMKSQTEFYRGRQLAKDRPTHGALYWQHNSVWVAPTWSGMESTGRYKMLQYAVKRFFKPLHVIPYSNPSSPLEYKVVVTNDRIESFLSLVMVVDYVSFDSNIIKSFSIDCPINARETLDVFSINIAQNETCLLTKSCFLRFSLVDTQHVLDVNYVFPNHFKDLSLPAANVTLTNPTQTSPTSISFLLQSSQLAFYVFIRDTASDHALCRFSENHIEVLQQPLTISYTCPHAIDPSIVSAMTTFHLASMSP